MRGFDVAVVGAGIVGSAVAFHAARRGGRVVVFDAAPQWSATAQSSGIVRVHQPDLALAPLSFLGWQEYSRWEEVVCRPSPFEVTGCVHEGAPSGLTELRALGWRCQAVGADELRELYPAVSWPDGTTAVYEPDAGWADAAACRAGYLGRVADLGGSVRRRLVHEVVVDRGAVTGVRTDDGVIGADAVVVAAGAWASTDPVLGVRSRRIVWQRADPASSSSTGPLPCYVREGEEALYFRPTGDGGVRFGVGCDDWDVAPDTAADGVHEDLLARGRERVGQMVAIQPASSRLIAAVDGYTAGGRPVVERSADVEGLFTAVGFSGGGFKMAPAVGSLLAEWIETGTPDARLAG